MGKVVLLTGPPAVGKSTLRRNLELKMPGLIAVDYGQRLLNQKSAEGTLLSYDELRTQSATIITPLNVTNLDEAVISEVAQARLTSDVILDSHAVTRESYGFRAIPYSLNQLGRLGLDAVLVLRCDTDKILARMSESRGGRREVTVELATEHQLLQEAIGASYAIACGCSLFVLDTTNLTTSEVTEKAYELLAGVGFDQ